MLREDWNRRLRPEFQGFDLNVGGCDYGGPPSYFAPYRNPALKDGPEGEYLPDRLADECIAFLETPSEKPLFLCWWNYSVHYPIQAPQDLIEKISTTSGGAASGVLRDDRRHGPGNWKSPQTSRNIRQSR